jgi:hypothetical protein
MGPVAADRLEGVLEVFRLVYFERVQCDAERGGRRLHVLEGAAHRRISCCEHGNAGEEAGQQLLQQLQPFLLHLEGERGKAGDVSAWTGQVRDNADTYRIADRPHDDRDRGRCAFSGKGRRRAPGDNDVDGQRNKLGGQRGVTFVPVLRPAIFKLQILSFDIAPLAQTLAQALDWRPPLVREHSDDRFSNRLLRARRERPSNCRAA